MVTRIKKKLFSAIRSIGKFISDPRYMARPADACENQKPISQTTNESLGKMLDRIHDSIVKPNDTVNRGEPSKTLNFEKPKPLPQRKNRRLSRQRTNSNPDPKLMNQMAKSLHAMNQRNAKRGKDSPPMTLPPQKKTFNTPETGVEGDNESDGDDFISEETWQKKPMEVDEDGGPPFQTVTYQKKKPSTSKSDF